MSFGIQEFVFQQMIALIFFSPIDQLSSQWLQRIFPIDSDLLLTHSLNQHFLSEKQPESVGSNNQIILHTRCISTSKIYQLTKSSTKLAIEWHQERNCPQNFSSGRAEFGLFSLETRRLWGDLIATLQHLKGVCKKAGEGLFARACGDKTRGNVSKLR